MKHCVKFEELISAYIDNELDVTEKVFMEEHFKSCADCLNLFVLYREMSLSFTEATVPPPPELSDKVMDIVRNSNYIPRREPSGKVKIHGDTRRMLSRYLPLAACLAIALLALPYFLSNNRGFDDYAETEARMAPAVMFDTWDEDDMAAETDFGAFAEATQEWQTDTLAPAGTPAPAPAPAVMPDAADDKPVTGGGNEGVEAGERFIFDLDNITETYYAYIEIDHDPPDTIFRSRHHENYYLIRRADVAELFDLLEDFVILYIPGYEHAEFALVLFME